MQTRHQGSQAEEYPTILSIAASDPIAGAGVQADIRACSAFGVYAMTALTAVTVQDTTGVKRVHPLPADLVEDQLHTVCADIKPHAIKIGMIPDPDVAAAIADFLDSSLYPIIIDTVLESAIADFPDSPVPAVGADLWSVRSAGRSPGSIVLDPVLAPTSGEQFSSDETLDIILTRIIPHTTLLTPNLPEARKIAAMLGCDPSAESLAKALNCAVLLKGGHGEGQDLIDILAFPDGETQLFRHPRIDTPNTHGTGCTLSSAIAANLALGHDLKTAVSIAIPWMHSILAQNRNLRLGHGHGPTLF